MEQIASPGHLCTSVSGQEHDDDTTKQQFQQKYQGVETGNLTTKDLLDVRFLHGRTHSMGSTMAIKRRKDPSVQLSREKADPQSWLNSKPGTVYKSKTIEFTDPGPLGLKFEHGRHLDSTDHHPVVKDIASHVPDAVNKFRRGDLLLEVNGIDTLGKSPEQLNQLLRKRPLRLTVVQQPLDVSSSLLFPNRHFVPPPEFSGFPEFSYENLELPKHERHLDNLANAGTTSTRINELELKSTWDSLLFNRTKTKFRSKWASEASLPAVDLPEQQVRSWTRDGWRNEQGGTDFGNTAGFTRMGSTFVRKPTTGFCDDNVPTENIGGALTNIFSRSDYCARSSSSQRGTERHASASAVESAGTALPDECSTTLPASPDRSSKRWLRVSPNVNTARREVDLAKRQALWSTANSIWNERPRQKLHVPHVQLI